MGLSNDLISQFVKVTNDKQESNKKETIVYGTTVEFGGAMYVIIDGSEILTPASTTADVKSGERVTVMIKNHTAIITGNVSSPSASSKVVDELGKKFDNLDPNLIIADNAIIKEKLVAQEAIIGTLQADVGTIDTLIFGSATGNVIQTSFSNAVIAQLGNAQIKSAMIESVSAGKITAGDIITNNVRVKSQNGLLLISDETIQISDTSRVRVQIGKDASNDYSINVWDANGNLMFSKGGITDSAIKQAIIRNDMVSDTANIAAHKLDIDSLFEEINDSSNTIKSTKIYLDDKKQTLDVAFKSLETTVTGQGETISSQGTAISAIQGQISSKIWQQDINTAKGEMSTQYSTLTQTVDSIGSVVSNHTSQFNNLRVGGKNLIRDSKLDKDTDLWSLDTTHCLVSFKNGYLETTREYSSSYTSRAFHAQYSSTNPLLLPAEISGKTFVLQAEFKAVEGVEPSNNTQLIWRVYYGDNGKYEEMILAVPSDLTSTGWRRCYVKRTFGTQDWKNAQLSLAITNSNNGVCVRNVMLEQATVPSAWIPAPEDFEASTTSAETRILQTETSITGLASRTTATESAIATLELTADGLTTKVNAAKKQLYHSASGTSGTAGYVGFCSIRVGGSYQNRPILFELNNRGRQASNVSFCFENVNNSDPGVNHLEYDGGIKVWAYKTDASMWTLIADKSEGYDTIYVKDFANNNGATVITWTNVHYSSLPTENITAGTKLAGKLTKATVDNAAKTATNYLNFSTAGLVIGDMTASTLGKNVLIDSDSVDIRNGNTTLASFGADYLYLAKNSRNATIDLCNGLAKLYHQSKYSYDTLFVIDTPNATEIQGTYNPLCVTSTVSGKVSIQFANTSGVIGSIGMVESGTESYITRNHPSTAATYSILDTGNFYKIMDSGWINCTLNTGAFTRYSNDLPQPQVRKIGKQVYLRGEAKPSVAVTPASDSDTVIATIPSGYRPSERQQFIMQGSGSYRWMMSIHTDGRIAISRYTNSTTANMNIAAGAWLCCHAQWLID